MVEKRDSGGDLRGARPVDEEIQLNLRLSGSAVYAAAPFLRHDRVRFENDFLKVNIYLAGGVLNRLINESKVRQRENPRPERPRPPE